jgi:GMP synthase-like glutamine amidotransferase
VLGGKVAQNAEREIGWWPVRATGGAEGAPGASRCAFPAEATVLHWHGDRCVLPPGAELLASSLHCRVQAFRIGARAVGLQFHVEVLPEQLELWLEQDHDYVRGALGPDGVERIRADARRWEAQVMGQGQRLIANLLDLLTSQEPGWG